MNVTFSQNDFYITDIINNLVQFNYLFLYVSALVCSSYYRPPSGASTLDQKVPRNNLWYFIYC